MTYDFKLSCALPASPEAVYDAWLDSASHGAMTGAPATIGNRVGEPYAAWDGYITGRTLKLVPDRQIVQSWRTSEFDESDADSTVTVDLERTETGTLLTLTHRGVPDGQTGYEKSGWRDFYFAPMLTYFARGEAKSRPKSKSRSDRSGSSGKGAGSP